MSGIAGTSARDTEVRLPRATKVKNKQPASQQVGPVHRSTVLEICAFVSQGRTRWSPELSGKLSLGPEALCQQAPFGEGLCMSMQGHPSPYMPGLRSSKPLLYSQISTCSVLLCIADHSRADPQGSQGVARARLQGTQAEDHR